MANYESGTLLTCSHIGCPCRLRVEVECHCSGATESYRCTCGAEMVPVEDSVGAGAAD
ncbi:metallothionein [Mycobacterium hubeiense]|uniref:metallothionein n=1 Tax=Mycobacterium hubeiense TaxID=1867256 RepID=UPI000C7E98C9|nr:metallothionein [Mycobacterium sp. QGD 101]